MQTKKATSSISPISVEYNGFSGIDRSEVYSGKGGIADIVNFKVTDSGALQKRPGAKKITTLNSKPRAYYRTDDGNALLLISNRFCILDTESFSASTVTTVGTFSGDADIFCYDGRTFLLDGGELYVYESNDLIPTEGYAPLYGKDWDPTLGGDIHEAPNLLSDKLRITYLINGVTPSRFFFGLSVSSIDGVYADNDWANPSKFALDEGKNFAACGLDLSQYTRITFYVTSDTANAHRSKVTGMTRAAIFGSGDQRGVEPSSVAFYSEGTSSLIACTRRIAADEFSDAAKVYPSMSTLYVTDADILTVGDGSSPINAARRRGGRLMIFTAREAYALTESGHSSILFPVSCYAGCTAKGGALSIQDRPVTISEAGILAWAPVSYDNDEYVAECISRPIQGLTSPSFHIASTVYLDRRTGELWFSDPDSDEKRVFIYNSYSKRWYSYSGISADMFFETKSGMGFFKDRDLYVFSEDVEGDYDGNTVTPVNAYVSTGIINFGGAEDTKRLCRIFAVADPDTDLKAHFADDLGRLTSITLTTSHGDKVGYADARISIPRSRHYTVTLTASSDSPVCLRRIKLSATE